MRIFLLPSLQLAFFLSKVRDWKAIVPDNVTFKNAFRARKWLGNEDHHVPLPQSFTYMARAGGREIQNKKTCLNRFLELFLLGPLPVFYCPPGLPNQGKELELSERTPRAMRADSGLDDVFAMVKERMADDTLSQPPLLVLPGNMLQQSKNLLNVANSSHCPLETAHLERERLDELRMLRHAIGIDFPHLSRALAFYDTMIEGKACSGHVPPLSFLRRASTSGRAWLGCGGAWPKATGTQTTWTPSCFPSSSCLGLPLNSCNIWGACRLKNNHMRCALIDSFAFILIGISSILHQFKK